jgi:hypothetical protein
VLLAKFKGIKHFTAKRVVLSQRFKVIKKQKRKAKYIGIMGVKDPTAGQETEPDHSSEGDVLWPQFAAIEHRELDC